MSAGLDGLHGLTMKIALERRETVAALRSMVVLAGGAAVDVENDDMRNLADTEARLAVMKLRVTAGLARLRALLSEEQKLISRVVDRAMLVSGDGRRAG